MFTTIILSALFILWLLFGVFGTLALYIGYGFVMTAQDARNNGRSQNMVVKLDSAIALMFIALDAALNLLFYSVICLDFRKATTINLITGRLCIYNADTSEWAYRRKIADIFAAFLDGKDITGQYDHVKGINHKIDWLD